MKADQLLDPSNWMGRLALFAIYPVLALFLAFCAAFVLVFAWPCILVIHKFPPSESP